MRVSLPRPGVRVGARACAGALYHICSSLSTVQYNIVCTYKQYICVVVQVQCTIVCVIIVQYVILCHNIEHTHVYISGRPPVAAGTSIIFSLISVGSVMDGKPSFVRRPARPQGGVQGRELATTSSSGLQHVIIIAVRNMTSFRLRASGARGQRSIYGPTFSDGCLFCKHLYH